MNDGTRDEIDAHFRGEPVPGNLIADGTSPNKPDSADDEHRCGNCGKWMEYVRADEWAYTCDCWALEPR